jgi:predicted ATPase
MRLDKLHIFNYKDNSLRNFTIDFDEGRSTTVLIGRNGSGKSNLIEAIIEIFRDLELNNPPAFKTFLDRLRSHSFAPIRNIESIERDVRGKTESTERLYLFIKNQAELAHLKTALEDAKTLFGYLESLFLCDLMDEVRVTVERTDGTKVKFTQLTEGEQQLLTVLGLMLFTQDND